MSEANATTRVRERFDAMSPDLRTLVDGLDAEIAQAQAALDELQDARKTAARMLRLADPTFEPQAKPGRKPNENGSGRRPSGGGKLVSEKRLADVQTYLEKHRDELTNGNGFTASMLVTRRDWTYGSQSYLSQALRVLHDRGVIRLDHVGGMGGAKHYRLV